MFQAIHNITFSDNLEALNAVLQRAQEEQRGIKRVRGVLNACNNTSQIYLSLQ